MPTYEYQCDGCEHNFDEFQMFSEEPLKKCPQCGKNKLRRVFGAGAAVIFKGSGFYQTDYRSESYTKAAQADKDAGKGTSDKKESTGASSPPASSDTSAESGAKSGGKKSSPKA